MTVWNIIWILVLIWSLVPVYHQRRLVVRRYQAIRAIEQARGTRVITLIHRQEMISFFGLPLSRYITIDDSEQVLRAIHLTPPDRPVDLVLHTPGGLVLAAEQIAQAIHNHPAPVTVFVPHYAMSGGTLIALAAREVILDENAVLGPVDPQLGEYPAASIVEAVRRKGVHRVDDKTLILADVADKALQQIHTFVDRLLQAVLPDEAQRKRVVDDLTLGHWTHDYPIKCETLNAWGLPVRCGMSEAFYHLMDLYPQPGGRRPSVQYIPVPYRSDPTRRS